LKTLCCITPFPDSFGFFHKHELRLFSERGDAFAPVGLDLLWPRRFMVWGFSPNSFIVQYLFV
jgi:hypothetical protein